MAQETFVVGFDSDEDGRRVLDYAIGRAKRDGARLVILHVLEWSPYSFLTPEEIEERHARRENELARAREILMDPAVKRAKDAGLDAVSELQYGSPTRLLAKAAETHGASLVFVGRTGSDSIGARLFGSVPLGLAQICTVPLVLVP
jgi:nucleotide-binding universal stress UspA family protein